MDWVEDRSNLAESWKLRNSSSLAAFEPLRGRNTRPAVISPILSTIEEEEDSEVVVKEDNILQDLYQESPLQIYFRLGLRQERERSHKPCPPLLKRLTPLNDAVDQNIKKKIKERKSASVPMGSGQQGSPVIGKPTAPPSKKQIAEERSEVVWVGGQVTPRRFQNPKEFGSSAKDEYSLGEFGSRGMIACGIQSIPRYSDQEIAKFLSSSPLTSGKMDEIPDVMKNLPPLPSTSSTLTSAKSNKKLKLKKKDKYSCDSILSLLDDLGEDDMSEISSLKDCDAKEVRLCTRKANPLQKCRTKESTSPVMSINTLPADITKDTTEKKKSSTTSRLQLNDEITSDVRKFSGNNRGISSSLTNPTTFNVKSLTTSENYSKAEQKDSDADSIVLSEAECPEKWNRKEDLTNPDLVFKRYKYSLAMFAKKSFPDQSPEQSSRNEKQCSDEHVHNDKSMCKIAAKAHAINNDELSIKSSKIKQFRCIKPCSIHAECRESHENDDCVIQETDTENIHKTITSVAKDSSTIPTVLKAKPLPSPLTRKRYTSLLHKSTLPPITKVPLQRRALLKPIDASISRTEALRHGKEHNTDHDSPKHSAEKENESDAIHCREAPTLFQKLGSPTEVRGGESSTIPSHPPTSNSADHINAQKGDFSDMSDVINKADCHNSKEDNINPKYVPEKVQKIFARDNLLNKDQKQPLQNRQCLGHHELSNTMKKSFMEKPVGDLKDMECPSKNDYNRDITNPDSVFERYKQKIAIYSMQNTSEQLQVNPSIFQTHGDKLDENRNDSEHVIQRRKPYVTGQHNKLTTEYDGDVSFPHAVFQREDESTREGDICEENPVPPGNDEEDSEKVVSTVQVNHSVVCEQNKEKSADSVGVDDATEKVTNEADIHTNTCQNSTKKQYLELKNLSPADLCAWWSKVSGGKKLEIKIGSIESWIKQTNDYLELMNIPVSSSGETDLKSKDPCTDPNSPVAANEPLQESESSKQEASSDALSTTKSDYFSTEHKLANEGNTTYLQFQTNRNTTESGSFVAMSANETIPRKSDCQASEHKHTSPLLSEFEGNKVKPREKDKVPNTVHENGKLFDDIKLPSHTKKNTGNSITLTGFLSEEQINTSPPAITDKSTSDRCIHQSSNYFTHNNIRSEPSSVDVDGNNRSADNKEQQNGKRNITFNITATALQIPTTKAEVQIFQTASLTRVNEKVSSRFALCGFDVLPNKPKVSQRENTTNSTHYLNKSKAMPDGVFSKKNSDVASVMREENGGATRDQKVQPCYLVPSSRLCSRFTWNSAAKVDNWRECRRICGTKCEKQAPIEPVADVENILANPSSFEGESRTSESNHVEVTMPHAQSSPLLENNANQVAIFGYSHCPELENKYGKRQECKEAIHNSRENDSEVPSKKDIDMQNFHEKYQLEIQHLQMELENKEKSCKRLNEAVRVAMERNDILSKSYAKVVADGEAQRKYQTSQIQHFVKQQRELRKINDQQINNLQSLRNDNMKMENSLINLQSQLVNSKNETMNKCEEVDYWMTKFHEVIDNVSKTLAERQTVARKALII